MSIWKGKKQRFAQRLIENIKEISFINKEGKLSYYGGFNASPYDFLSECINLDSIPNYTIDTDMHRLVKDVIKNLILSDQEINESSFVRKFHSLKINPIYQETKHFQVVVEAFLKTAKNQKYNINECEIRVLTKKFPRNSFLTKISHELMDTIFYVKCRGRNSSTAVDKALSSINLLRSIWYLSAPSTIKIEGLESQIKPNNPVEINNYCYFLEENIFDPYKKQIANFTKDTNSQTCSNLDVTILKNSQKLIKSLNRIKKFNQKYYQLLTNSMIQYFNALDSMDRTNSLPLLWGALETLGKKGDDGKYDELINRCSFLFKDNEDKKNILEIVKDHRNNYVHYGNDNVSLRKLLMINTEQIYRQLFKFHIYQALEKKSFEDTLEFLSLPCDKDSLTEKKKIISKAIRYRTVK